LPDPDSIAGVAGWPFDCFVPRRAVPRWLLFLALALAPGCGTPTPVGGASGPRAPTAPGSRHLVLGEPNDGDPSDDILIDHGVFVLSYNPRRGVANWVAWLLVADDLGEVPRSGAFHADELLPPGMPGPRPRDYARSGFERGHMCPSGDRTATAAANEETFVMTNMLPQRHALNVGPWEGLERYERTLASSGRQVFIVAGGLFDGAPELVGCGIAVPRANFKIVVAVDRGAGAADITPATTTYAVIMPNTVDVSGTAWPRYLVSIDDVERQSGYDFLSQVPAETQALLEARRSAPPLGHP
jgi:endonuclease G